MLIFMLMYCVPHFRVLKKLRTKSLKEIELERKEQGFTLYLNGANTRLPTAYELAPKTAASSRPNPHKPKTVDSRLCLILFVSDFRFCLSLISKCFLVKYLYCFFFLVQSLMECRD